MTEAEIQKIVEKAVETTLLRLGVDTTEGEAVVEFQRDMHWMRTKRLEDQDHKTKIRWAVIATSISALAAALWAGVQSIIDKVVHPPS